MPPASFRPRPCTPFLSGASRVPPSFLLLRPAILPAPAFPSLCYVPTTSLHPAQQNMSSERASATAPSLLGLQQPCCGAEEGGTDRSPGAFPPHPAVGAAVCPPPSAAVHCPQCSPSLHPCSQRCPRRFYGFLPSPLPLGPTLIEQTRPLSKDVQA